MHHRRRCVWCRKNIYLEKPMTFSPNWDRSLGALSETPAELSKSAFSSAARHTSRKRKGFSLTPD